MISEHGRGQKRAFVCTYLEALTRNALTASRGDEDANREMAIRLHQVQLDIVGYDHTKPTDQNKVQAVRGVGEKKKVLGIGGFGHAVREARKIIGQADNWQYLSQATMLLWTSEVADAQPLYPASLGQPTKMEVNGESQQLNLWQQITYDSVSKKMQRDVEREIEFLRRDMDTALKIICYLSQFRDIKAYLDDRYERDAKNTASMPGDAKAAYDKLKLPSPPVQGQTYSSEAHGLARYLHDLFKKSPTMGKSFVEAVDEWVETFETHKNDIFDGEQLKNIPQCVRTTLRKMADNKTAEYRRDDRGFKEVVNSTANLASDGPLEEQLFAGKDGRPSIFETASKVEDQMASGLPKYAAAVHHFELVSLPMCVPGATVISCSTSTAVMDTRMMIPFAAQKDALESYTQSFPERKDDLAENITLQDLTHVDEATALRGTQKLHTTMDAHRDKVILGDTGIPINYNTEYGWNDRNSDKRVPLDNRRPVQDVYPSLNINLQELEVEKHLLATSVTETNKVYEAQEYQEKWREEQDDRRSKGGLLSCGSTTPIYPSLSRVWWTPTVPFDDWKGLHTGIQTDPDASEALVTAACRAAILRYLSFWLNNNFTVDDAKRNKRNQILESDRESARRALVAALSLHVIADEAQCGQALQSSSFAGEKAHVMYAHRPFHVVPDKYDDGIYEEKEGQMALERCNATVTVFPLPAVVWKKKVPIMELAPRGDKVYEIDSLKLVNNMQVAYVDNLLTTPALATVLDQPALPLLRGVETRDKDDVAYQPRAAKPEIAYNPDDKWKNYGTVAAAGARKGAERRLTFSTSAYGPMKPRAAYVYVPVFAAAGSTWQSNDKIKNEAKPDSYTERQKEEDAVVIKRDPVAASRFPPPNLKDLTPERIRQYLYLFIEGQERILNLEQQQKALARVRKEQTPFPGATPNETQQAEAVWSKGDLSERAKRDAVWSDAIRELDMSGDRLYSFLRQFAGFMHADIKAVARLDDQSMNINVRSSMEQRKRLLESETSFQHRIMQGVVDSLLREAKLRIEPGDVGDPSRAGGARGTMDAQLAEPVVINDAVQERLRALASGESNLPYFAASQEIQQTLERMQEKPATLRTLLESVQHILDKRMKERLAVMTQVSLQTNHASMEYLQQPRVSFVIRLEDAAHAAIHSAYLSFQNEWALSYGAGRAPMVYQLIEGADPTVSTQFAMLCAAHMTMTRGSSMVASSFSGPRSMAANNFTCAVRVRTLVDAAFRARL